jgi:hypothetical protein
MSDPRAAHLLSLFLVAGGLGALASRTAAAQEPGPVLEGRFEVELSGSPGEGSPAGPRRFAGTVKLTLTGTPPEALRDAPQPVVQLVVVPEAELFVDDRSRGRITATQLPLEAGDHTLRLEHPGYLPLRRRVKLLPGQTVRVVVDLAEEAVARRASDRLE